jgi:hypothetical protein
MRVTVTMADPLVPLVIVTLEGLTDIEKSNDGGGGDVTLNV